MKIKLSRSAKILLLLAGSFLAIYLSCYFVVMRDDLKYLFVFKHALRTGPHYPPSIIVGLTIMSFVALWAVTLAIVGILKWRHKQAARA